MKKLTDAFAGVAAVAAVTAFFAVGLGCAAVEKITGRDIMGPKTGF